MLTVLMGLVALVLFVVLALAGAMLFGRSLDDTKALAAIQAVTQVSGAASLYRFDGGRQRPGMQASDLVAAGYLKTEPTFRGGSAIMLGVGPAAGAYVRLKGNAKGVCRSINRQTNRRPDIPSEMVGPLGCYSGEDGAFFAYANG
jgi:hypothetical protein